MELNCETLSAENDSQILLVYTATPGTQSAENLRLLSVIGTQAFANPSAPPSRGQSDSRQAP